MLRIWSKSIPSAPKTQPGRQAIVEIATGGRPNRDPTQGTGKTRFAAALGRKGGKVRAERMSARQRSGAAGRAARHRWGDGRLHVSLKNLLSLDRSPNRPIVRYVYQEFARSLHVDGDAGNGN